MIHTYTHLRYIYIIGCSQM